MFPHFQPEDWDAFARRTYRALPDGRVGLDYDPAITATVSAKPQGGVLKFLMWRLFAKMKRVPLLILRGAHSDILEAGTAQQMLARHKQAKLVEIAGVGHAPMLDEADAVAALTAFLAALETA